MIYKNLNIWGGSLPGIQQGNIAVQGEKFVHESQVTDSQSRDFSGLFALPGLIDAHVHMCLDPEVKDPLEQTVAGKEKIKEDIRRRAALMLSLIHI